MNNKMLCYVDLPWLYFTDNMEKQWGDDWNDAPYEHNAGTPYEYETNVIKIAVYINNLWLDSPCDKGRCMSVEEINKAGYPWLKHFHDGSDPGLKPGTPLDEAITWLKEHNCEIYTLKE